jgi:PiT family inorganic phosphate transporter
MLEVIHLIPLTLIVIILLSWCIDYINGFHDTANAIATVVATGVMPAKYAIIMAAALNFLGAMMGTAVASTIASGLTNPANMVPAVIIAALLAAIIWDLLTWWFGIPSSTSHTVVGGLAGAVAMHAGIKALNGHKLREFGAFIVVSPLSGFIVAITLIIIIFWIVRRMRTQRVNYVFRKLQLISAAAMAFTHGQNDAQKAMGVICLGLISYGFLHLSDGSSLGARVDVPIWVKITCASMMGLGTATGGWKIIKTLGHKIAKLKPIHGFAAETAAALVLFTTAHMGIPVSTTHSISGAIMGVGSSMNAKAVKWGLAGNIFTAWVLTIPVSALLSATFYCLIVWLAPSLKEAPKAKIQEPTPAVTVQR